MRGDMEARLDRVEARMRRVLELLADAPVANTTISDSQGDFMGHDHFISPDLREEAQALLDGWDEEDAAPPGVDSETKGGGVSHVQD